MRLPFLIFFFIVLEYCGFAQSSVYLRTYDIGNTNPIISNLIETDNNFIAQGQIVNSNAKILLIKFSKQGNIISDVFYGDSISGDYLPFYLIKTSSNKLINCIGWQNFSPNITTSTLLKLDTSMQVILDTSSSIFRFSRTRVIEFKNRLYFGGSTIYNNNWDSLENSPGIYKSNFLFWKTDTIFNHITHNSIGDSLITESLYSISSGFDNNLLLGGLTFKFGNQQDWYMVNTDTNGQVIGEYYYGDPNKSDYDGIKSITQSSDSNYFLTGRFYMYNIGAGNYYYSAKVVKIDRDFNTLWTKQIGSTVKGIEILKMISISDDNQAILIQRMPTTMTSNYYSQVTKFNNNGNILWARNFYKGDTTQYIRYRAWDLIETSDKGFAFCGSAFDTTNVGPYQHAWLVKTDSLGCDGLRSCNDTSLVVEILDIPDTICTYTPNWISVRIKGRSAPYRLYANSTLALDSVYYPYTLPLWIDTIIPFVPTDTGWQQLVVIIHEPWNRVASDTVQVYVDCVTGFTSNMYQKEKVEIYPNPATTELHVKIRGIIKDSYTIEIYDTQGKTVEIITTKEQESVIDISKYKQGVYWVRVIGNNILRSEKVIKLLTK